MPFAYNDFAGLQALVDAHPVGVIKMEVVRNMGPQDGFLEKVRELATARGIVLIFDECTSGFRQTFGGLHKQYGVEPDMAIFGKTLGNGYAITATIGRRAVMGRSVYLAHPVTQRRCLVLDGRSVIVGTRRRCTRDRCTGSGSPHAFRQRVCHPTEIVSCPVNSHYGPRYWLRPVPIVRLTSTPPPTADKRRASYQRAPRQVKDTSSMDICREKTPRRPRDYG